MVPKYVRKSKRLIMAKAILKMGGPLLLDIQVSLKAIIIKQYGIDNLNVPRRVAKSLVV